MRPSLSGAAAATVAWWCAKLSNMSEAALTRSQVAAMVDHTLLKPEATAADVTALIDEARSLGCWLSASRRRCCRFAPTDW
ncbi:hypothetical protein GCM10020255_061150 [Rhodococcus baikonurensis]